MPPLANISTLARKKKKKLFFYLFIPKLLNVHQERHDKTTFPFHIKGACCVWKRVVMQLVKWKRKTHKTTRQEDKNGNRFFRTASFRPKLKVKKCFYLRCEYLMLCSSLRAASSPRQAARRRSSSSVFLEFPVASCRALSCSSSERRFSSSNLMRTHTHK